jgi:hypothetical protein
MYLGSISKIQNKIYFLFGWVSHICHDVRPIYWLSNHQGIYTGTTVTVLTSSNKLLDQFKNFFLTVQRISVVSFANLQTAPCKIIPQHFGDQTDYTHLLNNKKTDKFKCHIRSLIDERYLHCKADINITLYIFTLLNIVNTVFRSDHFVPAFPFRTVKPSQ